MHATVRKFGVAKPEPKHCKVGWEKRESGKNREGGKFVERTGKTNHFPTKQRSGWGEKGRIRAVSPRQKGKRRREARSGAERNRMNFKVGRPGKGKFLEAMNRNGGNACNHRRQRRGSV